MRLRKALGVAALGFAVVSGPAAAQGVDEDVRCLLASNLFTKAEKDPAKRQVATMAAYFYLGRVDARMSGQQLAAALKAQRTALNAETAGPIMTACAKKLQSAGLAIQTLGKQIEAGK